MASFIQIGTPLKLRLSAILLTIIAFVVLLGSYAVGTMLVSPRQLSIGNPPPTLKASEFEIPSKSGSTIQGWNIAGQKGHGVVVLAHGIRANRLSLIRRTELFASAGYSVILFDFQAHGESIGKHITLGYLEAHDIRAVLNYAGTVYPQERIAVIGMSLGGASLLLSGAASGVDAIVLEAVYPDLKNAVKNRLEIRLGTLGRHLSVILLWQLKPRLGFYPSELRPIRHAGEVTAPAYVIGGSEDRHTTPKETEALYHALKGPKRLWIVQGAAHQDFYRFSKGEYISRILPFISMHLNRDITNNR